MGRLDAEARMAIKALAARGSTPCEIARLLGVTEGAVRYHARRMAVGAVDKRTRQRPKAQAFATVIEHWRTQQDGGGANLAALHAWLRREYGYDGSLRSVQRYWPAIRARRRVETPPGAQAQVDWAHFPAVIVGDEAVDLVALHMVLSWSRQEAIVWARSEDMLAWLGCHTACFVRLGGVAATLRVDNEKTASARGAGAGSTRRTGAINNRNCNRRQHSMIVARRLRSRIAIRSPVPEPDGRSRPTRSSRLRRFRRPCGPRHQIARSVGGIDQEPFRAWMTPGGG